MAITKPLANSQDPWGKKQSDDLPDLEEIFKKVRAKFIGSGASAGGGKNGNDLPQVPLLALLGVIFAAFLSIWAFMGFYTLDEQERGVVLRFGKYTQTLQPGLQWQPYLIDKVTKVNVTKVRSLKSHGFMLTKDGNIVEVTLMVQYFINNPKYYVLNVQDPERTLSNATDSVIRHEVGDSDIDYVLTEGRAQLAEDVMVRLQEYADNYTSGLEISKVNIENTQAPKEVQHAFDDVNRARADKDRYQNQAQAYANSIVPEARGHAKRQLEEAEGYKAQVIANATGEADRFTKLVKEYKKAPQVTKDRLYIDAVEEVLSNTSKVMISLESGNNMMYLPLDQLIKSKKESQPVNLDDYVPETSNETDEKTRTTTRRTR